MCKKKEKEKKKDPHLSASVFVCVCLGGAGWIGQTNVTVLTLMTSILCFSQLLVLALEVSGEFR